MKSRLNRGQTTRLLKIVTHIGALIPLATIIWANQTSGLGADPVRLITLRTGEAALVLLVLSLAVTPAAFLLNWKATIPLRRLFGLYSFLYVSVHLLVFLWLDYGLDLAFIVQGVLEQNFVLVGFAAFLLMIPLALTSNRRAQRWLGQRWKPLHKLNYLIAVLVIIHFLWLVKNVYLAPGIYGAILALLFLLRWQPAKRAIQRRRANKRRRQASRTQADYVPPAEQSVRS